MTIRVMMHPKPAKRHTHHVEPFTVTPYHRHDMPNEPLGLLFFRKSDDATQRMVMTREAAQQLYEQLGVMLRYGETSAADVDAEDFAQFRATITDALTGKYS